MNIPERIVKGDKVILIIPYAGKKESEMIELVEAVEHQLLKEAKPVLVMSIYDEKTYITPAFMREVEKRTANVLHLIDKQALVGLSPTKKIILKGYNFMFNRNIQAFDTQEQAMAFLLDAKTSDKGDFWSQFKSF